MDREERKRKFTEAIVNMLYPPRPEHEPEPPSSQPDEELKPVRDLLGGFGSDAIPDTLEDHENASTSGDEEQESEPEKLTRARRKKIRKKKLKEEAIRRGNLIGPLLPLNPTNTNQCADRDAKHSPPVRSNASENDEKNSGADELGAQPAKKVNHRREAKKMAKVKRKSFNSESSNQHSTSNPSVDLEEAH